MSALEIVDAAGRIPTPQTNFERRVAEQTKNGVIAARQAELTRKQSLPLDEKISLSRRVIQDWYEAWDGQVSVSYSGGKKPFTITADAVPEFITIHIFKDNFAVFMCSFFLFKNKLWDRVDTLFQLRFRNNFTVHNILLQELFMESIQKRLPLSPYFLSSNTIASNKNTIEIFENEEFGKVRITEKDGEPWFVAKDICE